MKRYIRSATDEQAYTYDELSDHAKNMAEFCVSEEYFTDERYSEFIDKCNTYLESKLPGSTNFDYDFDFGDSMDSYFIYYTTISLTGLYNQIKDQLSESCVNAIEQALENNDYKVQISVGASPRYEMEIDFLDDVKHIDTTSSNEFNEYANDYTQSLADNLKTIGYEFIYPWRGKEGLSEFCKEHGFMFDKNGELVY